MKRQIFGIDLWSDHLRWVVLDDGPSISPVPIRRGRITLTGTDPEHTVSAVVDLVESRLDVIPPDVSLLVGIATDNAGSPDATDVDGRVTPGDTDTAWAAAFSKAGLKDRVDAVAVSRQHALAWAEYVVRQARHDAMVHFEFDGGIARATRIRDGQFVTDANSATGMVYRLAIPGVADKHADVASLFVESRPADADAGRTVADVARAARDDDAAFWAIKEAGHEFGVVVADTIAVLDPGLVTFGGDLIEALRTAGFNGPANPFLLAVEQTVWERLPRKTAAATTITASTLGDYSCAIGASILAHAHTGESVKPMS